MPRVLLGALGVLVCVFLVAPAFIVIPLSFSSSQFLQFPPPGYTLGWYRAFLVNPTWMGSFFRSVYIAGGVIVLSVILGSAAAYALTRGRQRFLRAIEPIFVLPMVVPVIVFAVGAYILAIRLQILGSMWVIIVAHSVLALPFVVLNVAAALRTADRQLELAAQTLGASQLQAFLRVTLPLIAPAMAAGAVLAGLISFDETVAALFLAPDHAPTLPVRMYSSIRFELDPLVPVAATLMLAVTIVIGAGAGFLRRFAVRGRRGLGTERE